LPLGSVLLIQAVLQQNHIVVAPLRIAFWAIPTALVAFAVHAVRLLLLEPASRARGASRMIGVGVAYALAGVLFAAIATFTAADRAHPKPVAHTTGFWASWRSASYSATSSATSETGRWCWPWC